VTEQRPVPAAKYGSETLCLLRDSGVSNRINATMDPVKPACLNCMPDRFLRVCKPCKLRK